MGSRDETSDIATVMGSPGALFARVEALPEVPESPVDAGAQATREQITVRHNKIASSRRFMFSASIWFFKFQRKRCCLYKVQILCQLELISRHDIEITPKCQNKLQ